PDALLDRFAKRLADELDARRQEPAAAPRDERGLYSLAEAAAWFGRSERWVRERVKRGELRHVKLDGGALAFRLEDLQAFVDARLVPPLDDVEPGLRAVGG